MQKNLCVVLVALLVSAALRGGDAKTMPAVEPDRVKADVSVLAEHHVIAHADYWLEHVVTGGKCDGQMVADLLTNLAKVFQPDVKPADAIDVLVEHGIIGGKEYWTKNAVAKGECAAGNVAVVLGRAAGRLPAKIPKSAASPPLEPTPAAQIKSVYDIVVAGAGTGGCGAAVQAARMGRSVLLLEETDWVGGQMTAAAVTSMDEGRTIVRERGLYRELCGLIASYYQPLQINYETAYGHRHVCVEPRVGQRLLRVMLGDARGNGVLDLVLRSRVTKVQKAGDRVTGVEVESVSEKGRETHTVASQILIDGTEWGDVIPLTGARYRTGNCLSDSIDPARRIQDLTWTAVIKQYPKGVPAELRMTAPPPGYDKWQKTFERTLTLGDPKDLAKPPQGSPWSWARFIGYRGMPDSTRPPQGNAITRTHMNFNNDYPSTVADLENPASRLTTLRSAIGKTLCLLYYVQTALKRSDWSVANDEGYDSPYNRKQMDALIAAQPEFKPYRDILIHFSVMAYARESRRIVGLHTLCAREIERIPGKPIQFPNTVALGDYAVDLHGSMTPQFLELDLDHPEDIPHKFGERGLGPFAIPFECFIPEKVDGFLPAEKNISQSRMANGATRLQPHTLLMGQAVGAIAALSIQNNIQPRALDPKLVQRVLLDAGDTLSIEPVKGSAWGTAEWKAKQMEILHGN